MALQPGAKAPDFSLQDQNGNTHNLADYKGKKVALYFYPKDDTPGCTAQACNLRDNMKALTDKGVVILGASTDDAASHQKFEKKYDLNFPLLIDTDKTLVQDYDVWGEKQYMGKTYMGTHRVTYLIDENGAIAHVIEKVDTKDHTRQILDTWGMGEL